MRCSPRLAARSRPRQRSISERSSSTPFRTGIGSHPFSGWTWRRCCFASGAHKPSHQHSPICFVLSSFDASGCPSPLASAIAGVAAPLTSLAGAGVLHWRSQSQGFAGRLEVGSPPTLSCGIWISQCRPRSLEVVVDGLPLFGGSPARN